MNGTPTPPNTDDQPGLPSLARPEAARKVSRGISERVSSSLDNTGKALAAVAGVGVFFFAAGYFVQWQRFKRGGLPPEEVMALLPKGQVAAAGVKELFISLVFGGALLGIVGWGMVTAARLTQGKTKGLGGFIHRLFSRELLFPTAVVGVFTLVIVPWDKSGVIAAFILTALFLCMLFLVQRFLTGGSGAKFPLWQMCLAVGLTAIVLTGARLWGYPEARAEAIVFLDDGSTIEGAYVGSDSGKVLIRKGPPPHLMILSGDEIVRMRLWKSTYAFERDPSLVDEVILEGLFNANPNLNFSCIPPECRWDNNTRFGPSSAF